MTDEETRRLIEKYSEQVDRAAVDFLSDPVYTIEIAKAAVAKKQRRRKVPKTS